jgi:hypothetical protein
MDFWDKVKSDIQKGIKEGVGFVKEGVSVVREKAEELTEEGKKRLSVFELKTKVHREISELGGRVYDIRVKVKNPMSDSRVKAIISRVKKLEDKIEKLEGAPKSVKAKKAAPKSTAKPKKKL